MSNEQEEIQKKLEELKKRTEQFQSGGGYQPPWSYGDSSSGLNPKLKLILIAVGVIIVLAASVYFAVRSFNSKKAIKAPPGYNLVYPSKGPPYLEPKQ
jgi:hypothetical protein